MRRLKMALIAALALNAALAAALGYYYWRRTPLHAAPAAVPAQSEAPPATSSTAPAPAPLAPIQLSPRQLERLGVRYGSVARRPVAVELRTVGNVAVDEQRLSTVQLRFAGWIQTVFVNATYQQVRRGQPLFTIYSPDLVSTEQEVLIAQRNLRALSDSPVPGVASGAETLLESALARLRQWGVPPRELRRLAASGQASMALEIDSPAAGFVLDRAALPNLYAQPETRLYTLADLSTVWVNAELYQDQLEDVAPGNAATITVDTFPGRKFPARVDFIYPNVDPATRTVRVRFALPNPRLWLKPGMFVNVDLTKPLGTQLVIPSAGVLQTGTRQIAFVARADGYLAPRDVELGPAVGDDVVVLNGLRAGERIVTSANFLIDSESQLQAAFGSLQPPQEPEAPAPMGHLQASLAFTTSPSPPQKGANAFRVRLTGPDAAPIAGATVTVAVFMPAMPAMGMAAMSKIFALTDRGGGFYEGQGVLPSGGTWQVTIAALRHGQLLASRRLSIAATGGN